MHKGETGGLIIFGKIYRGPAQRRGEAADPSLGWLPLALRNREKNVEGNSGRKTNEGRGSLNRRAPLSALPSANRN